MARENVSLTVDIVLFTIRNNELNVLLIKRLVEPFKGMWALPGGFLLAKEELADAAKRELYEETGVRDAFMAQLYTKGDMGRDPRGRVITIVYYSLLDSSKIELHASTDAKDARWFPIKSLPTPAFDHETIIHYAIDRVQNKIEYTNIAFQLLPEKFTLTELQTVYEIIMNRKLDKRNFRKKLKEIKMLKELKETKMTGIHRPAKLYSFILHKNQTIFRPQKTISG